MLAFLTLTGKSMKSYFTCKNKKRGEFVSPLLSKEIHMNVRMHSYELRRVRVRLAKITTRSPHGLLNPAGRNACATR